MRAKPAEKFTELIVWQKAHRLVLAAYQLSKHFPDDEKYGLTSQLKRAAVSVPANIAESFRKQSKTEKARFLNIAQSSLEECRYYFILSNDLGYGDARDLLNQTEEVSKLLFAYRNAVKRNV